jgi:hypothetical protein
VDRKPHIADLVQYDEFGPCDLATPEKRLIGAVVLRAVLDFHSVARCDRNARRSARIFLFSDNPRKSLLREYLALLFQDPEGELRRLRAGVLDGSIRPKKVATPE